MGWLWSPAPKGDHIPPESTSPNTEQRSFALTEEQRQRIFGKPGNAPTGNNRGQQKPDQEIEAFFKSFDTPPTTSTTSGEQQADDELAGPSKYARSRVNPDGSLSIHPSHLYPRTMSCRQAFDQAFYCQSLGGKFNDIYRYGHLQSCSDQWQAFWFCMRNRTLPNKNKEEIVADFYADREKTKKKEFGSSEDVWELRERAVERAFWRDPSADDGGQGE